MFKFQKGKIVYKYSSERLTHSYFEKLMLIFMLTFMWILFAYNTYNVDMPVYKSIYRVFQLGNWHYGVEFGFACFLKISSLFKLSYEQFLIIYSFIGMLIMAFSIIKYTKMPTLTLIFYLFFPFLHELCAIRFFMGNAIALCSIQVLMINKKNCILKYIIGIFLGSLFHNAILLYLLYLLCLIDIKRLKKIISVFFLMEMMCYFFLEQISKFFIGILPKLSVYLTKGLNGTRNSTKLFFVLYYIAILFFNYQFSNADYSLCKSKKIILWQKMVNKLMYINILFFPIIILDLDFYRIGRCVLILLYAWFGNYIAFAKTKNKINKILTIILFFIFTGILTYFFMFRFSYTSVVTTILNNNEILRR